MLKKILQQYPKNPTAQALYKKISFTQTNQHPSLNRLKNIFQQYEQGQVGIVINECIKLLEIHPKSFLLLNLLGMAYSANNQLQLSLEILKKSIEHKPDYSDAYNNLGNTYQKLNQSELALSAYDCALKYNQNFAEAHNNKGNVYKKLGEVSHAENCYRLAIKIKREFSLPYANLANLLCDQGQIIEAKKLCDHAIKLNSKDANAHNVSGCVHLETGNFELAIQAILTALQIDPTLSDAHDNLFYICAQLKDEYDLELLKNLKILDETLSLKSLMLLSICEFVKGDFKRSKHYLSLYENSPQDICQLHFKDQKFCKAFAGFLQKLLTSNTEEITSSEIQKSIYHVGESHCLSFAHLPINVDGDFHQITPLITFGAKAYHLAEKNKNKFQSITEHNMNKIPQGSRVFLSFGEIDCRPDEGFITASAKLNRPVDDLIENTVKEYVNYFVKSGFSKKYSLTFVNIPAPVDNPKLDNAMNEQVLSTIRTFNKTLVKFAGERKIQVIDVYNFTARGDGFSNQKYHVDARHLGALALPNIESQFDQKIKLVNG